MNPEPSPSRRSPTDPRPSPLIALKSWPLAQLPGLFRGDYCSLGAAGLETTGQLLRRGQSPQSRQELATALGVPLRQVQKWLALAELAALPTVGCDYCGLLLHCGVQSLGQLAAIAPAHLHRQIQRLHASHLQRRDLCPSPAQVQQWILQARTLARPRP